MLRFVSGAALLTSLGGCNDAGRLPLLPVASGAAGMASVEGGAAGMTSVGGGAAGMTSVGGGAAGGGEAVEPRQAEPMLVDVPDGAPPHAVPGCTPWPEGVARTQKQFEIVPVTEPEQTFVLDSPARVIRFYDDQTELSLRTVHRVYERGDGVVVDSGVPYLKVGDGCLELLERIELQNGGYGSRSRRVSKRPPPSPPAPRPGRARLAMVT